MKVFLLVIVCLAVLGLSEADTLPVTHFSDFQVYKVLVNDDQGINDFKSLGNNLPVHYLNDITGPGQNYYIVSDPANQQSLESLLNYYHFNFSLAIENLQNELVCRCGANQSKH